jgi:hypothetical protein
MREQQNHAQNTNHEVMEQVAESIINLANVSSVFHEDNGVTKRAKLMVEGIALYRIALCRNGIIDPNSDEESFFIGGLGKAVEARLTIPKV